MTTARGREKFKFSAHPDDALEGGLADDFDGTVVSYKFQDWAYPNTNPPIETSALVLTISQDDPPGEEITQPYGIGGKPGDWEYSRDEQELLSGPKGAFDKRSGAHRLMVEIVNAGVDPEAMKDGTRYDWLAGFKFHWRRKEREGATTTAAAPAGGGRQRTPSDLLPTKLISSPRGQSRGRQAPARAGRPAPASTRGTPPASAPSQDGITPDQIELVKSVLTARGDTPKTRLPSLIIQWKENGWADVAKQPVKTATAKLTVIDDMIANGFLLEEKGVVSLPPDEEPQEN